MKHWLFKIEVFVDRIIPYLVLILLALIIGEFTHYNLVEEHEDIVLIIDYTIVIFFLIDLAFKYHRVRNAKTFVKKYWLDILAVFPFFLIFRLIEEISIFLRLGSQLGDYQKALHTSLEVGRISEELVEEQKILREIEEATKLERTSRFGRLLRPLERIPRIFESFRFYEKPFKYKKHSKK
ncbi:ion transporter [Candidatus Woesearchaeota archaeon]|nr:ion transporter [Candidatus Woesearchaeota archaeon]